MTSRYPKKQWSLEEYEEIRLSSDLVWPELAESDGKARKEEINLFFFFFFCCTVGYLNSSFVPTVGRLPVCF